ncbi:MAG: zf-TFIIB domain-containing protein [Planctomycetota bacterium]|nr:zf-TFIIB domain-containing protein [Planctomycetota bacterium]
MNAPIGNQATVGRVLQPCSSCARVLDVTGLALGTEVRCACTSNSRVVQAAPLQLRAFTCGRCGGAFQEAAANCPWCEASIVLQDRKLAGVCGRCSARLDRDARFCPGCGLLVHDQVVKPLAHDAGCPRCRARLAHRRVAEREIVECTSCGGIWLEPRVFEDLCSRSEVSGALRRTLLGDAVPTRAVDEQRVAYVKCVTCAEFMFRKNLGPGSGLILDVCKDHGVWFDHDELVRALDFAERGGLERVRLREERRLAAEKARAAETLTERRVEPREFGGAPTPSIEDTLVDTVATLARMLFGRHM